MKPLHFIINDKNVLKNYREHSYHYCVHNQIDLRNIIIELLQRGETDLNCIDVSKITDMRYLFSLVNQYVTIRNIDISDWDVSNVEIMTGMFYGCYEFNSDLSNWDVSNVKFMGDMFEGCEKFNSDLSNWDVSNVKFMHSMFRYCEEFNSDLSKWNVSKVKNMIGMFYECKKLNKIPNWYK